MTTVSNINQLQQRSEELQSQGYEAVLPGAFCAPKQGGNGVYSWGEYVHHKLTASATMTGAEGNAAGQEETTLWLGDIELVVDCDKAIQLLSALEMYALECFNVTAAHKKAVSELDNIEEVLTYDYKSGYPEKLKMEV